MKGMHCSEDCLLWTAQNFGRSNSEGLSPIPQKALNRGRKIGTKKRGESDPVSPPPRPSKVGRLRGQAQIGKGSPYWIEEAAVLEALR